MADVFGLWRNEENKNKGNIYRNNNDDNEKRWERIIGVNFESRE